MPNYLNNNWFGREFSPVLDNDKIRDNSMSEDGHYPGVGEPSLTSSEIKTLADKISDKLVKMVEEHLQEAKKE
jgi:hypothetical protein